MNNYELSYSKFLADISEQIARFIKNAYLPENTIYDTKDKKEIETENIDTNNTFENVDNTKVELVDYKNTDNIFSDNKTLLYIVGAIIIWSLLRGKK